MPPFRILIVDDSDEYAECLTLALGRDPRLSVVGRAVDGLDGIAAARRLRPDAVVVDVNMPRLDGFTAARAIRLELPDTRIVIVSGQTRPDHTSRAREAGADVYLPKDVDLATLADVVADERSVVSATG